MTKKIIHPAAHLSLPEIEALVARIADLRWTRQQVADDQEAQRRALNERIAALNEDARPDMEKLAETIHALSLTIDEATDIVADWARAHQSERFSARRSMEFLHGIIGFRRGKPRVEARAGRKFERAAYWLARLTWGRKYLRPAAVNREAILRDRAMFEARPQRLRKIGLAIVQDETFYIDLKESRSDAIHGPVQHKEAA